MTKYEYLSHHGILGQRWGIRRYQNYDGTRTAAGRKRYSVGNYDIKDMPDEELDARIKRLSKEQTYKKLRKNDKDDGKLQISKDMVDVTANAINRLKYVNQSKNSSSKRKKFDLSNMTDEDLRKKINRENLERQYNQMFAPDDESVSKGQKIVNNILDYSSTVLALGSSALAIALAISKLKKGG